MVVAALAAATQAMVASSATADGMARDVPREVRDVRPEDGRVCYFRADTGYAWTGNDHARGQAAGAEVGRIEDRRFDDSWFGEIGVGCGWTRTSVTGGSIKDAPVEVVTGPGLRADVTVGYRGPRDFNGVPPIPPAAPVDPVHGRVNSFTLMFNGYVDLGNFAGWMPYLGAGIGVAWNELENVHFTNGVVVSIGSRREADIAWALMAGVSRDLGSGLMLDVGYRYIDLGEIGIAGTNGAGASYSLRIEDLTSHEVRVGIRVPFN